ncbi:MAG: hypothetical protein HY875_02930 [Chloroflexi bacterium]|nr:hypothetical protein [Chloroflexota bacterium]
MAAANRKPTNLRSLRQQVQDLLQRGEEISSRSGERGIDAEILSWLLDYDHVLRWAEVVATRVAPDKARKLNWSTASDPDLWPLFSGAKVHVQVLLNAITVWEAEGRLFAEPPREFVLIDADTPYSTWVRLQALLNSAKRELWVADPYLREEALELFVRVPAQASLRLLGSDRPPAVGVWQKFQQERGGTSEYRVAKESERFHDRFLGLDGRVFLSGASLKDAGRRFSALIEFADAAVASAVTSQFEQLWGKSAALS